MIVSELIAALQKMPADGVILMTDNEEGPILVYRVDATAGHLYPFGGYELFENGPPSGLPNARAVIGVVFS